MVAAEDAVRRNQPVFTIRAEQAAHDRNPEPWSGRALSAFTQHRRVLTNLLGDAGTEQLGLMAIRLGMSHMSAQRKFIAEAYRSSVTVQQLFDASAFRRVGTDVSPLRDVIQQQATRNMAEGLER